MRKVDFTLMGSVVAFVLAAWLGGCTTGIKSPGAPQTISSHPYGSRITPLPGQRELWIIGRSRSPLSGTPLESQPPRETPQGEDVPLGGELRVKVSGEERTIPLPLKHTGVKGQISISIASVNVRQEYHNPYGEKIEAVYVFPLPEDAAVRDFVMTIGDRYIRGIIREREEARRIYLEARRQGYVASLLTEERPNIFTQSVANIEPGKNIEIDITYFHTLKYKDGEYEFVFPMVVGPRFNPPGFRDGVAAVPRGPAGLSGQKTEVQYLRPGEISSHDISLELDIDAGLPLEEIRSPSHQVDIDRLGENRARVCLSQGDRIPNKDFVLRYRVSGRGIQAALATHRDESGGYFTLVLDPPLSLEKVPAPPREMVFVLDCSGSMSGAPITLAKEFLKKCLQRMRPCDSFQVIRFSERASQMGSAPIPANSRNVKSALQYVDSLQSGGGTMMIEGVKAALDFPHDEEKFRILVFLTDGYIGNEREILREVRNRLGASRLFSFGVGSSVNRYLLEEMARVGRGAVAYVGLQEQDLEKVDRFFQRIEHPAMADISMDWGDLKVAEVYPNPIPDLFVGRPVVLAGRFDGKGGQAAVKVQGKVGGRPREIVLSLDLDDPGAEHEALGSIWARAKIASLYGELADSPQEEECEHQIRQIALQYGLVSDYTAFVAVDSLTRTEGDHGTSVMVPVPVPAGVRYETTVGER